MSGENLFADYHSKIHTEFDISKDIRNENDEFNTILIPVILTINVLLIPLIIVPNILVVFAVILQKKLHNPHNIILLAISACDMMTALVVIPIRILYLFRSSREYIFTHNKFCISLFKLSDAVELSGLSILTLLGLDAFVQIAYPLKYRMHVTNKKTIIAIITIVIQYIFLLTIFMVLRIQNNNVCHTPNTVDEVPLDVYNGYLFYKLNAFGLQILMCIIFGCYVRYKRWKRDKTTAGLITQWLLMAFVIFYLPSIYSYYADFKPSSMILWYEGIARFTRYMVPATNPLFIYLSRPHFRFAFKFFLQTNPVHWSRIDKVHRLTYYQIDSTVEQRKSKATARPSNVDEEINLQQTLLPCEFEKVTTPQSASAVENRENNIKDTLNRSTSSLREENINSTKRKTSPERHASEMFLRSIRSKTNNFSSTKSVHQKPAQVVSSGVSTPEEFNNETNVSPPL